MALDAWLDRIDDAADAADVPRHILRRLVAAESGGDPAAVSSAGAIGLTQLMPATAAELAVDPRDPVQNLAGGATYLRRMYEQFGDWRLAANAYNWGPGNLRRHLAGGGGRDELPAETRAHEERVFGPRQAEPAGGLAALPRPRAADPAAIARAMEAYETPLWAQLDAHLGEGWYNLRASLGLVAAALPPASREHQEAMRRAMPRSVATGLDRAAPALAEDDWKASPWYRPGVPWDPAMTEARARAIAEEADDRTYRRWLIAQSPDSLWRGALGFGAELAVQFANPVNYVPVLGPATRAALAARLGVVAGRAAAATAENVALSAALAPVFYGGRAKLGDDTAFADVVLDLTLAGAFGAVLGAGHGLYARWRQAPGPPGPRALRPGEDPGESPGVAPLIDARLVGDAQMLLDRAATGIAEGRPAAVPPALVRELADRVQRAAERTADDVGERPVYRDVRDRLAAAGRPDDEAHAGAMLWDQALAAMAERYAPGRGPAELYRALGLEIRTAPIPGAPGGPAGAVVTVDPDTVRIDAKRFQFKAGGDEAGVTDRLHGVAEWDPYLAGTVMIWEDRAGRRWIADGHQRLGLARRLKAQGRADVVLNAFVLREADGIGERVAMMRAAAKNIAEGTGTPIDVAKVLKIAAEEKIDLPPLPPRSALVRDGRALADLADDAFGMAVNGVVPPHLAAIAGRLIPADGPMQVEALRLLARLAPENAGQAEFVVRELIETGVETRSQASLFGAELFAESVVLERAQILDAALRQVKRDKAAFATILKESERLTEAGNVLAAAANLERLSRDERVLEVLTRIATRKGPVSDALTAAARRLKAGELRRGEAARAFLRSVAGRDLAVLERGAGDGGGVAGDAGALDRSAGEPGAGDEALAADPRQATFFQKAPGLDLDQSIRIVEVAQVAEGGLRAARHRLKTEHRPAEAMVLSHRAFPDRPVHFTRQDWDHAVSSLRKSVEAVGELQAAFAHLDATRVLPRLFEASALVERRPAARSEAQVTQIYRFFGAMRHGPNTYAVKMTVREHAGGQTTLAVDAVEKVLKLYDMHLPKRMPPEPGTARTVPGGASPPTHPLSPSLAGAEPRGLGDTIILRDLLRGIKGDDGEMLAQRALVGAGEARGAVEFADGVTRITLGATADASTFLHETGHVFLDLLDRLGDAAPPSAAALRDRATVRQWLGAADGAPLTRDQHERWAAAFETWLAEGRAPSLELVPVFERFRRWLLDVYRRLVGTDALEARIAPDVRRVMDRMVATDEQLARARLADPPAPGEPPEPPRPPGDASPVAVKRGGSPGSPTRGEERAAELGVTLDGDFDEAGELQHLIRERGITQGEAAELAAAGELVERAAAYARAYEAAAGCLARLA
jgi:hypothetical protein